MNLSSEYGRMGDAQNHSVWLEKAKNWAPKGSATYKYFHPGED